MPRSRNYPGSAASPPPRLKPSRSARRDAVPPEDAPIPVPLPVPAAAPEKASPQPRRGVSSSTLADPTDPRALERELVGRIMGGCRVESLIGAGGMGAVFLGLHLALDRPVALKVLPHHLANTDGMIDRFVLEARAVARIEHPNIVQVYDIRAEEGLYYIIMQYVDGPDTCALMMEKGPLPVKQALDIITQVARALVAIHGAGVIHRDLKPTNILLSKQGVAKVTDLGLVKLLRQTHIDDVPEGTTDVGLMQTHMSTRIGTPAYMAPEQAEPGSTVDGRADIYALGATLFHLITGRPPFEAATADEILEVQRIGPVPNPRTINPWLPTRVCNIIARMMAKEPDHRYASASELLKELETLAESDLGREGPPLEYSLSRPALKLNAFLVSTVLERQLATGEQIEDCLRLQADLVSFGSPRGMSEIFIERELLTQEQLDEILTAYAASELQRHNSLFSRIALGAGVLHRDGLREAQTLQRDLVSKGQNPMRLDELLLQHGLLTPSMVDVILRAQESYVRNMDDSFFKQAGRQAGIDRDAIADTMRSLQSASADDPRSLVQVLVERKHLTPAQAQELVAEQLRRLIAVMAEGGPPLSRPRSEFGLHSSIDSSEWSVEALRAIAAALPGNLLPGWDAAEKGEVTAGPWSWLSADNVSSEGVSLPTLTAWIRSGRIGPDSMVRGPTTGDRWTLADRTPGVSKHLGQCPHCQGAVEPNEEICTHCERFVDWPAEMKISDPLASPDDTGDSSLRPWTNRHIQKDAAAE